MATHGSNDFFAAIDPVVNRSFYGLEAEVEKQMSTIYKVGSDDEPIKSSVEYGGPGNLTLKTENAAVQGKSITQGPIMQWSTASYAGAITISEEAADDVRNRYAKVVSAAGSLGRATNVTPELLAAVFLDQAFTDIDAARDGLAVCSTSHTIPSGSATFSNALATPAALDETSAEDMRTLARGMIGPDGNLSIHKITGWIVPTALVNKAEKLNRNDKTSGSANNDPSVVSGTKVLPFDYLSSSTRWFAKTNNMRGLFWDWIKKPTFVTDQVVLMLQKVYVAWFRARYGIDDVRGLLGSNAT